MNFSQQQARKAVHCWGCGEQLARTERIRVDGHTYCSVSCAFDTTPDDAVDMDEQDRRAAAEERIENHRRER